MDVRTKEIYASCKVLHSNTILWYYAFSIISRHVKLNRDILFCTILSFFPFDCIITVECHDFGWLGL